MSTTSITSPRSYKDVLCGTSPCPTTPSSEQVKPGRIYYEHLLQRPSSTPINRAMDGLISDYCPDDPRPKDQSWVEIVKLTTSVCLDCLFPSGKED
ncbi:MAG: hypothetical protein JSS09_01080 [Verrucomicrobia bacterium]|nr:hypothetical protein [Verrucomicrobiota bacterium]